MALSYSPSAGGFFDSTINSAIPSDAVAITAGAHAALLAAQATGQVIAMVDGVPTAQAAPAPVLTPAQVAAQIIVAGCQITSTATSSLNGTYPLDDSSIGKVTAIAAGVASGKGLPGGGSSFNLLDLAATPHAIGSADFLNLASALESYVYDVIAYELALAGGHTATAPAQPVVIP